MKKQLFARLAAISAGSSVLAGNVMAAVPVEVTTALTDAKTDALAVAALALIVVIGIAAFKYMRRGV